MNNLPVETRRLIGCGFEKPACNATPWSHPGQLLRVDDMPTVCPGYTTKLPEVVEIARARFYCNKGALGSFCGGSATERIREGIERLESSYGDCEIWSVRNPPKGGA